jgi:peptidoglycan/xylan/chitin deacetylase (PgdA/CDA1 family)
MVKNGRTDRPAIAVVAGAGELEDRARPPGVEIRSIAASPRALRTALSNARADANRTGALVAAIVPASHPELIVLAAIERSDRIAVHYTSRAPIAGIAQRSLRASFALVDLTIVPDDASERGAIKAGADPERLVPNDDDALPRLLREPPRKDRRIAALEMAASLVLDAVEATGLLRLVEIAKRKAGVNVVNYHRILPLTEVTTYCRPQMVLAKPLFEAQLDVMSRAHGFVPIERMRDKNSYGRVAITFDDGYEDNFRVALPILQRFSTPACIFVVTNLIGRTDALWWDRLGFALFAYWRGGAIQPIPPALPPPTEALRRARSIEEVRAIVSELISELNRSPANVRDEAVKAAESLVLKFAVGRTMLSWEEVEAMARLGITFGAHTKNHVPLDEVSPEVAREELFGSQKDLDRRLDHSQPKVLALPRGRLGALTEEEIRQEGFRAIMTSVPGINRPDERSLFVRRRDGRMLTLYGRHHPAKLRLELTGLVDRLRSVLSNDES